MKPKKSIEYSEMSWNYYTGDIMIDGKCAIIARTNRHACWFYRRSLMLAGRFGYDSRTPWIPTIHEDKLEVPLKRKKPTIWAVSFMGDISYCPDENMVKMVNVMRDTPQHTYIMLTKRPEVPLFRTRSFPKNVWFGTTVNRQDEEDRIDNVLMVDADKHWVSVEPPYEELNLDLQGIDGIAIGAETGPYPFQPKFRWIDLLIKNARKSRTKIVIKDNVDPLLYGELLREWP